ncbi:cupredoxin domain-containing protein [Jeongeupia naejangsanensis]|uniref:Multicopper oxidase domain-containing protein n=1 Tax=Jeongeupia naejangsanensis TaxID=613195 RepID=A0ABS2BLN6_9NEIS|nr:multicopper oxidase domain-containing protein [Jeongeupia naejangsanensis]MBM3116350.1 multicopper oxidase domain-containing protein [Jeongeupia naejangsanensis]
MKTTLFAITAALVASSAFANGSHSGSHDSFGQPGRAADVTRTIQVRTLDTMKFEFQPAVGTIKKGETIRFVVNNPGQLTHEFAIGDTASQQAHAEMMRKMPGMQHEADATTVSLAPGASKTLIWKFDKAVNGGIVLACHIAGHYEAGMHTRISLN